MTDDARREAAAVAVAAALARYAAGDTAKVNSLLAHAVHDGVQPVDILEQIAAQTGGSL